MQESEFKTNLNTDLLKIIACISMLIDHIGLAFFPEDQFFRLLGRPAFPIFCYCMTVGLHYTRSIKKYLIRLAVFALISQPFYMLAFYPEMNTWDGSQPNILFTLLVSLLALWGFKEKKYWLFVLTSLITLIPIFDYSVYGVVLMLIFYLCRNKPWFGALLFVTAYLPNMLGNLLVAVLTSLLIFAPMERRFKLHKWFFYVFYPGHLVLIGIIKQLIQ